MMTHDQALANVDIRHAFIRENAVAFLKQNAAGDIVGVNDHGVFSIRADNSHSAAFKKLAYTVNRDLRNGDSALERLILQEKLKASIASMEQVSKDIEAIAQAIADLSR